MQFDQNRIVIRERDYIEVLDLALRVIRVNAWPLAVALVCGVVPAICLNAWLLAGHPDAALDESEFQSYLFNMLLLVIWEAPLVTAPITLYLGWTMFSKRPKAADIAREFVRTLPQMIWYQVVVRAILTPWVITWFLLFAARPYTSEVVLLERNPMFRGRSKRMTTGRRMKALHKGYVADLFARWLGAVAVGILLFLSVSTSIEMGGSLLLGHEPWRPETLRYSLPVAMWLVFAFFAVVRFLAYLDLRIRREGWEVELMMRAEHTRLIGQLT